jgi:beta-alanine--pyruvate transaminase
MDYAPSFNMGHPLAFAFASQLAQITPQGLDRIFFTNSGSESVDTALKIALAYHRARGKGTKTRLIGRERGYHGVGFGGISVGGIPTNRKYFGSLLTGVDHLPHTHGVAGNLFAKGEPEHGASLADELEKIVALHDASNIAAVIVEPVAGSTGVLVPPKGYLQRLRAICDKHDILLIFDEVITGFGRLGAPFAADRFGVTPDLICMAKGLTNAAVPCGAVAASGKIYDAMMEGADAAIELFHGYTYSAHPLACAAGLATLETYKEDDLFARGAAMEGYWQEAVHSLRDARHVIDIRNLGLVAGIELEARPGAPTARAMEVFEAAFDAGLLTRVTADIIALSPPLIIDKPQVDKVVETLWAVLGKVN